MYAWQNLKNEFNRLCLLLPRKDRIGIAILFACCSFCLIMFPAPTEWLETSIIDFKHFLYGNYVFTEPSKEVLILAIDTETLEKSPFPWPWPDEYWANIINKLGAANPQPKAIIVDVFFQPKAGNQTYQNLSKALRATNKSGLVGHYEQTIVSQGIRLKTFAPPKYLRDAASFWGLTQQKISKDGRIRSFLLFDSRLDKRHIAIELNSFLHPEKNPDYLIGERAESIMSLRHPGKGFPRIPLHQIAESKIAPRLLQDKILIIGATAPLLHDFHETSLGLVSGPEIVASAIETVMSDRVQVYQPTPLLRAKAFSAGILLNLILITDFFAKRFLVNIAVAFILPVLLLPVVIVLPFYFPVGLFWLTYCFTAVVFFVFGRLVKLSEIRQSLHEAEVCGKLQQSFFPSTELLEKSGLICSGKCVPYQDAGGDYYDFFQLPDGKIFFLLGDVSGHGISAGMITTVAKTVVSIKKNSGEINIENLFKDINTAIFSMTNRKMMMTLMAGIADPSNQKIQLASAGHLPAILKYGGEIHEYSVAGFPLGVLPTLKQTKLLEFLIPEKGVLILYSDGIIEALNWKNEQFGFERFNDLVLNLPVNAKCSEIVDLIFKALNNFVEGRSYEDDVTLLVLTFSEKPKELI